ncbi:MAG: hypothetical protein WCP97_07775 [bacterium]
MNQLPENNPKSFPFWLSIPLSMAAILLIGLLITKAFPSLPQTSSTKLAFDSVPSRPFDEKIALAAVNTTPVDAKSNPTKAEWIQAKQSFSIPQSVQHTDLFSIKDKTVLISSDNRTCPNNCEGVKRDDTIFNLFFTEIDQAKSTLGASYQLTEYTSSITIIKTIWDSYNNEFVTFFNNSIILGDGSVGIIRIAADGRNHSKAIKLQLTSGGLQAPFIDSIGNIIIVSTIEPATDFTGTFGSDQESISFFDKEGNSRSNQYIVSCKTLFHVEKCSTRNTYGVTREIIEINKQLYLAEGFLIEQADNKRIENQIFLPFSETGTNPEKVVVLDLSVARARKTDPDYPIVDFSLHRVDEHLFATWNENPGRPSYEYNFYIAEIATATMQISKSVKIPKLNISTVSSDDQYLYVGAFSLQGCLEPTLLAITTDLLLKEKLGNFPCDNMYSEMDLAIGSDTLGVIIKPGDLEKHFFPSTNYYSAKKPNPTLPAVSVSDWVYLPTSPETR